MQYADCIVQNAEEIIKYTLQCLSLHRVVYAVYTTLWRVCRIIYTHYTHSLYSVHTTLKTTVEKVTTNWAHVQSEWTPMCAHHALFTVKTTIHRPHCSALCHLCTVDGTLDCAGRRTCILCKLCKVNTVQCAVCAVASCLYVNTMWTECKLLICEHSVNTVQIAYM